MPRILSKPFVYRGTRYTPRPDKQRVVEYYGFRALITYPIEVRYADSIVSQFDAWAGDTQSDVIRRGREHAATLTERVYTELDRPGYVRFRLLRPGRWLVFYKIFDHGDEIRSVEVEAPGDATRVELFSAWGTALSAADKDAGA